MEAHPKEQHPLDVIELLQKDRIKLSCVLQNNIDGYGKNLTLSTVSSVAAREQYDKSKKYQNNSSLKQINYIYRLVHSTNKKYIELKSQLVCQLKNLGISFDPPQGHSHDQVVFKVLEKVFQFYDKSQNNQDCRFSSFEIWRRLVQTEYSLKKDQQEQAWHDLMQSLVLTQDQKQGLLRTNIMQDGVEYKDYETAYTPVDMGLSGEQPVQDPALAELMTLVLQENQHSLQGTKKVVSINMTRKAQRENKDNMNIDVNRVADIKNHIKEFMEKYSDIVMKGREFWSLFMFDILRELASDKEDGDVFIYLWHQLDHEESVEYLMTYRKDITNFLAMVRFFESSQNDLSSNKMQQHYLKEIQSRPTNYKTGGKKNSALTQQQQMLEQQEAIQRAQEQRSAEDTNRLLKLIGMSTKSMESDVGLKKKKKDREQKTTVEEMCGEVDFINMDEGRVRKEHPLVTRHDERDCLFIKMDKEEKVPVDEDALVQISELPEWAQGAFTGCKRLNTLQSRVYEPAFTKDENLLICAPTGAGKTNVAMLSVLQCISKFLNEYDRISPGAAEFKIVYISPMKALAAEIVEKFSSKLAYLGVLVREFTGDMSLTRTELINTHVIVTTPEKWDVITRKTDGMAQTLKLLIIDEIHLLNDERGPILECLVARTLRSIERLQQTIRIIGLSATLPNFKDVAQFIGAPSHNVFFFGNSYRPVPLVQYFIGVKDQPHMASFSKYNQRQNKLQILNDICYRMCKKYIKMGKQVMIFVHSRRETLVTAEMILKTAKDCKEEALFRPSVNIQPQINPGSVKSKQLRDLLPKGAGIHNAGLLRKDRNLVEKLFFDGKIRFLVTTATLAWGVNLPAYAVIIKGTDIYDPTRGNSDLSILDIKQIFGRAGRPQFDDNGEAVLITDINKVNQYIASLNNSAPIESKLLAHLGEALNAEISLNNISSQMEAYEWLMRTFLGIRLMKNPQAYGLRFHGNDHKEVQTQVFLSEKIESCIKQLDNDRLLRYDTKNLYVSSTEIGRITSQFYVRCDTMRLVTEAMGLCGDDMMRQSENKGKHQYWTDLQLMQLVARAKEFEGIRVREEEQKELREVIEQQWVFESTFKQKPKGPQDKNIEEGIVIDTEEKILAIVCAYMTNFEFQNFSLVVDGNYIGQNSVRIMRCIFELAVKKNMAQLAELTLKWCRCLEHRVIPNQLPLKQFTRESQNGSVMAAKMKKNNAQDGFLSSYLVNKLEQNTNLDYYNLFDYSAPEISQAMGTQNYNEGKQVQAFLRLLPRYDVSYSLKPIAQTIIKITVEIKGRFEWRSRWHGGSQYFWIIVDDEIEILHCESVVLTHRIMTTECSFFVPYRDTSNKRYRLSVCPDQWVNMDYFDEINLEELAMQAEKLEYTPLLDLQPLPISSLDYPEVEEQFRNKNIRFFNPIQTQLFHVLFHSDQNVLVGAPTGSGKTVLAELAMYRLFKSNTIEREQVQKDKRGKYVPRKVIYVAPLKALAKERLKDWTKKLEKGLGRKVVELTGDFTPDLEQLLEAEIIITTPEKWDGISRSWENRLYVKRVGLVVLDEIHLLGQDRGPVIEIIVTRMNYISQKLSSSVRMLGLSTAMANGKDVANWFGVNKFTFFNFKPNVRPCPITIYFDGFAEKHYCPRMNTMNKPAYTAIKKFSNDHPVLIFVSSRRQTRLTALDLIALASSEGRSFVTCQQKELNSYIEQVKDQNLIQTLSFGIGMHHAGLIPSDRKIVEDLFTDSKIQVMIATQTVAWGVNFPARLVIVKGTEYFDPKQKGYVDFPVTDLLQMIGRAGRPQFDDFGIACVYVEESKKNFYKKYLNDPFPIESSLMDQLTDHINAECAAGTLSDKKQCLDYLTWTYFFRRLIKNPNYYGLASSAPKEVNRFLQKTIDDTVLLLEKSGCLKVADDLFNFSPTFVGNLASYYYTKHQTIDMFNRRLQPGLSIVQAARILADATEFLEVPVRHNEDNYNLALSHLVPYPVDQNALESPHTKTLLLLQAHFTRCPLPIRDYLTDSKILLDGAMRLIHCMIDLAAHKGFLDSTLQIMTFMQMVVQGCWADDSSLINVANFDADIIRDLRRDKQVEYLCQLMESHRDTPLNTYLFRKGLDQQQIEETIQCIEYIPQVDCDVRAFHFDSEKCQKDTNNCSLVPGGEAVIQVNLKRLNHQYPLRVNMIRSLKVKDASWWIMVGNLRNNRLLALKKIFFKKTLKKEIQVQLPDDFEVDPKLDVFLVSDSYLGLDQIHPVRLTQ